MKISWKTPKIGTQGHGAKILPKSYFIHQEGPSVQIWWKLEKKWRFYEKRQNLAPRGHPGGAGQKFYQKDISYAERVLLSKFGENRMKNEDFMKNSQNWPPGAWSKNFTKKLVHTPRRSFCPKLVKIGEEMKILWKTSKFGS